MTVLFQALLKPMSLSLKSLGEDNLYCLFCEEIECGILSFSTNAMRNELGWAIAKW